MKTPQTNNGRKNGARPIQVWTSPEEHELIKKAAASESISVSSFIRNRILKESRILLNAL